MTTQKVTLIGWEVGAKKVSCTLTIQEHTGLGLKDAKQAVDDCLDGNPTTFEMPSAQHAEAFSNALREIGFVTET